MSTALLAGQPDEPALSPGGWPYTLSPYQHGLLLDDVWPATFFGPERVPEMKRKIAALPWAKAAYERMLAEAEQVLASEPAQPAEPVGWRHDYYSRASGEHLVYLPDMPDHHLDPLSGGYETLAEQHRAWVLLTHEQTHRRMRSLGFLYALSGDERYARWVAEGMRRAIVMFSHRELRNPKQEDALYFQPLYDAPVLLQLAHAYALTRGSAAYAPADHEAIAKGIFDEGVPYQMAYLDRHGVHNMTAYVSTAVAVCGQVMGRPEWVKRGLADGQTSLRLQLTTGVPGDDGFWYEGTMFYHFYSACPLITQFELDQQTDGPAHTDPEVRRRLSAMLAAPLRLADGEQRLPLVGDLGAPGVMRAGLYRHLYEYAAGQLDPARFGPALATMYSDQVPRASLTALAFGPDELPAPALPTGHDLLERPGFAVFRGDDRRYLLFKAGPHGADHDHPDKLEIDLRAFGIDWACDPGTAGYALRDIHPFYRSTFAHNTLFVDEASQRKVKDAVVTTDLAASPPWAQGIVRDAYPGVTMTRKVWFSEPYVVISDRLSSEEDHRYGWIFSARGEYDDTFDEHEGAKLPVIAPLAELLTDDRERWCDTMVDATWSLDGARLRALVGSDGPMHVLDGTTPYNPKALTRHTLILRASGKERRFWAVIEPARGEPLVKSARLDGGTIVVTTAAGERRYGE